MIYARINIFITHEKQTFFSFCSLKKMRSPILFLHAEDDHLVPFSVAQQVFQPIEDDKMQLKRFFLVATHDRVLFFGVAFCFGWTQLSLLSSSSCMKLQWVPRMQSESSWSPLTDLRVTCTTVYTETPNCLAS